MKKIIIVSALLLPGFLMAQKIDASGNVLFFKNVSGLTLSLSDSSDKMATTKWVKQHAYGGGGGTNPFTNVSGGMYYTGGYVGFGTIYPAVSVDVVGGVNIEESAAQPNGLKILNRNNTRQYSIGVDANSVGDGIFRITELWAGAQRLLIDTSGRVGLSGVVPPASAQVDITSTNRGFLLPRMSTSQRLAIGSPVDGLLVYDNTLYSLFQYSNGTWQNLYSATNSQWVNGTGSTINFPYNIGLGLTNPTNTIHAYDATHTGVTMQSSGGKIVMDCWGSGGELFTYGGIFYFGTHDAYDYNFRTNNLLRYRCLSSGEHEYYTDVVFDANIDVVGTATVNTQTPGDSTRKAASTAFVDAAIASVPKYAITEGSATMSGGTVVIATSAVLTGSRILYSVRTAGGTQGFLRVATVTNATSFEITSTSATETSVINWMVIN